MEELLDEMVGSMSDIGEDDVSHKVSRISCGTPIVLPMGWKHFFDGDSSELIVSPKKCIMSLDCNQFETPGSSGMGQQWTPLVTGRHMYGATLFKQCLYLSVNLEMGDFQATCLIHILVFNWNIIACSSENCRHFFLWLLSEQTSSSEQSLKPKPTSKNRKYELKNNRNKTRLAS